WSQKISPEGRDSMEAFARGVNHFLETNRAPLPVEFKILGYQPEPWSIFDSIAIMLYMDWTMNYAFKTELLHASIVERLGAELAQELFLDYPTGYPATIPESENTVARVGLGYLDALELAGRELGFEMGGASNSWVVAGQKSKSGKPLFANDPHLNISMPSIWYEGHITTPEMNVSGALVAGLPFIIGGANEHVAWGVTNSHHDDMDFYLEKINPADPNSYRYLDRWEKMQVKQETIRVKGGGEVSYEVKLTRHGPIIDDLNKHGKRNGYSLAMRLVRVDFLNAFKGYWLVNRAKNIVDIEAAAGYAKSGQNWIYADRDGSIGFYFLGGIPKRDGFTGELPVPGWDGRHEWAGYVPDREQPHLKDPQQGFIINANNKVEPAGYPHVITKYYATPDRFMRIQELLEKQERFGPADFENMLADTLIVMARDWMPLVHRALEEVDLSGLEKEVLQQMRGWDYFSGKDAVAPTVFNVFLNYLAENTFKQRLGETLYVYYLTGDKNIPFNVLRELIQKGDSVWFDDPETQEKEGLNDVLAKSFQDAVAFCEKKLGGNVHDWQWGKLHTLTIYHPFGKKSALLGKVFNRGPYPVGGSIFTVNPTYFKVSKGFTVQGGGASLRHIVDFADMTNSKRILPGGISGNFMSPHYDDQIELWLAGKFRPFVLNREAVLEDVRYRFTLKPDKTIQK
ncbi:MAG: penicillin acylase family protein, partial [Desulfobacterales bacterium]|nr:penicillin acylase family protein [Desulfobacterales bacterium]